MASLVVDVPPGSIGWGSRSWWLVQDGFEGAVCPPSAIRCILVAWLDVGWQLGCHRLTTLSVYAAGWFPTATGWQLDGFGWTEAAELSLDDNSLLHNAWSDGFGAYVGPRLDTPL
jgi:hypothetical protein